MAGTGKIYKRCGCRDAVSSKRLEQHCPRLSERGHGSWYFDCSAADAFGGPARARRGGFPSKAAAGRARDEWLTRTGEARTARGWTLERWLRYWLSTRTKIRPTTKAAYTRDVEQFLIPHLGRITLEDLNIRRIRKGFDEIAQSTNGRGQPQTPSCLHHLRTTLRAALNLAVRDGLLEANPIRHLELPSYRKPHAQVWTPARVAEWRATGRHPAVAVWTAPYLAAFLDAVTADRLFALWWLIALRGLRRGEACGLRWSDIDLDHGVLFIVRNRATVGYHVIEGEPKSAAGMRAVALDKHTVAVLREHLRRQHLNQAARTVAGKPCYDSGYVFIRPDGRPLHPQYATRHFARLVKRADLPPIRLHDLRHGAASLAHEAGADLKTVQDLLGHASILTTADTYTTVLPPAQRHCAEATARLVLAAARRTRERIRKTAGRNRPARRPHNKRRTAKKR
ncbi:tyrosine-type recombinase/integrase [Micromonospora olivasterospora]|uniref:Site-specific recombinase XerD n=1 Tax=Micromonospora olivasterospora TaxID=1880 RepID=A0A562I8B2_MICOL|nr:tyrosine-type recombinase/integrase [Micromonospora olivasterospora]TWH67241.1 site-specific recombinase XerD [Micromonospora olivasterospora]